MAGEYYDVMTKHMAKIAERDDVELELLINHYKGESPKDLLSNYFCTDC